MINRRNLFSKAVAAPSVIALAARNSRGGLLLGTAALAEIILTEKAKADQNYTSFAYNSSSGSFARTSPARWDDILNVLDFGAIGDGVSRSPTAIQSCFNAAFGPPGAPHSNVENLNKPVFFPKGAYLVTDYVSVTDVWGGVIFGAGAKQSTIGCNSLPSIANEGWRPLFWLNGCNWLSVYDMNFSVGKDTTTVALTSISNGSPAVFTRNAHGLQDGHILTLTTTGTLPAPLVNAAAAQRTPFYYIVNSTANTFNLAYSQGGAAINTSSAGSGTHSYITHRTACMWIGPDGGSPGGGTNAHGNLFLNCQWANSNYGIVSGSAASGANSENTYVGCYLIRPEIGMLLSGQNSLNTRWIGGSIDECFIAGIKTNNGASMPVIEGTSFSANVVDLDFASSSNTVVNACRSESPQFVKTNSAIVMLNCNQAFNGNSITASTSNFVMTVTAKAGAYPLVTGMVVDGGGITAQTRILGQITDTSGINVGMQGTYLISSGQTIASTTFAVYPVFSEVIGAGGVSMDSCSSAFNPVLLGNGNGGSYFIRNNQFYDQAGGSISAKLLSFLQCQVHTYDVAGFGQYLFSGLPAPSAALKGLRMFITDSTAAASTGNFSATVTVGGGTFTVPVWCDGTNWRIG